MMPLLFRPDQYAIPKSEKMHGNIHEHYFFILDIRFLKILTSIKLAYQFQD